jgi:hypothetical protein
MCLLAAAGLAAVLIYNQPESAKTNKQNDIGLPWEITVANANTSVFGLTLGKSSLNEVIARFGEDYEFALLAKSNQLGSLDLYYSHFLSGPIQGKLIVSAAISEADIQEIKNNPSKQEYLDNGTKKFRLTADQREKSLQLPIKSITLAPAARIDEDIIRDRFGSPAEVINIDDHVSHYVYKTLGLVVSIDTKGKDMLHYVSPVAMPDLIAKLREESFIPQE